MNKIQPPPGLPRCKTEPVLRDEATSEPLSPIAEAMQLLDASICTLSKRLDELGLKLAPISREQHGQDVTLPSPPSPNKPQSELGCAIDQYTSRIYSMARLVEDITRSLEL